MAPLARAIGTWLPLLDLAALLAITDRTLWRWKAANKIETREATRDGRPLVEVLVDSLPPSAQQKYIEHRAQLARAEADARAAADAELRSELSSQEITDRLARFDDVTRIAFKREATRRRELLVMWRELAEKKIGGEWSPAARAILQDWACPDPLVLAVRPSWGEPGSPPTIYRQLDRLKELGILALLPEAPKATRADDRRCRPVADEVLEEIKRLRMVRHASATKASLYRKIVAKYGDAAPSESTFKRLLAENVTRADMILARDGERAFNGRAGAVINRSYDSLDVGEWFCGDEHQFDLFAINPYDGGKLARPWITAFVDLRTRAPIGWSISFDHNTSTIVEAFIHGVRPKQHNAFANLCGLPTAMYIDNGKDYRSERFEFMLAQHRIEVHHALPFNAKAKNVERFFGTVCAQFSRDQVGYCGNNPTARPGRFVELEAQHEAWLANKPGAKSPFLTLAAFKQAFAAWVVEWVAREHDGLFEWETGRARSPLAVAGDRRRAPVVPSHELLEYLALPSFSRVIKRGQISIENVFYRHDELLRLDGKKVLCRRSPADVTELLVYTEADRFLCMAKAAPIVPTLTGGVTEQALKEIARQRRVNKQIKEKFYDLRERELAGDAVDLRNLASSQPEPPTPASSVDVAPEHAVIPFMPAAEREMRAARAARDVEAPAPIIEIPSSPLIADDEAAVMEQLGERPVVELWQTPAQAELVAEAQQIWDRDFAVLVERRRSHRAAQAAKGAPR